MPHKRTPPLFHNKLKFKQKPILQLIMIAATPIKMSRKTSDTFKMDFRAARPPISAYRTTSATTREPHSATIPTISVPPVQITTLASPATSHAINRTVEKMSLALRLNI